MISCAPRLGFGVLALLGTLAVTSCAPLPLNPTKGQISTSVEMKDESRGRSIPVTLYGAGAGQRRPLAVILPGYGIGQSEYGFLAEDLVSRGYLVAAIQLQLASDPPVPGGENLQVRRRPFWQRGVSDVQFVAQALRRSGSASAHRLVLVGHSHGGDTAMLLAGEQPDEVRVAFSLDNRRMPLPRTRKPRICSARSSDQTADPGVLPSVEEQANHHMHIVTLLNQRHDDMTDLASPEQKVAMIEVLRRCLDRP
jgi:dienelactone hydrolase